MVTSCHLCGPSADVITDDDTGARICLGCGAELSPPSNNLVQQITFTDSGTIDFSASCLIRPDLTYREHKVLDATGELKSIASFLDLPTSLSEEALQLAHDATDGEFALKGTAFLPALSAACCYIVARRHNIPLFLEIAADAASCDPHDFGHLVKRISSHLRLAPLPEFENGSALERFLRTSRLLTDTDKLEEIIGQGKFLLGCATKWSLSTGRRPRPLLAAVATLVAQANGCALVSVDDFAAEMGAVVSTSRVRYAELVDALAHAARVLVPWGADLTRKNVVQSAPLLIRLMELRSKSDPSDQFLENYVVSAHGFLNNFDLPVGEEEVKYFKIGERSITNGKEVEELENAKLPGNCPSSTYQNVTERIKSLNNAGTIGKGTGKRKRSYDGTFQMDYWVDKLDESRWRSCKKMTPDEISNIDVGFDAPPPSFVTGLKLRELRRERIKAAKCRIDKVRMCSTTEETSLVEYPVSKKGENAERKRKGALDGLDWEDSIIELLLLHGVNEAEIEEGYYKQLLDIHVFGL